MILGDDDRAIGHILDMGQDGIAFSCEMNDTGHTIHEATIIGYYENIGPISLRNIPLLSISDTTENDTKACPRKRMRFGQLTPSQRAKLTSFLWLNANAVHQSSSPTWA